MQTPFVPGTQPNVPSFIPNGYESLWGALNLLGSTRYGKDWTGHEWYARSREQIVAESASAMRAMAEAKIHASKARLAGGSVSNGVDAKHPEAVLPSMKRDLLESLRRKKFPTDEAEAAAQNRAYAVWTYLRGKLYAGVVQAQGLGQRGDMFPIPREVWASDSAPSWIVTGRAFINRTSDSVPWVLIRLDTLSEIGAGLKAEQEVRVPAVLKAATGRKTKHDWEGALIHLGIGFQEEGYPADQAEAGRRMADWFAKTHLEPPGDTEIKARAQRVMHAIRRR